MACCSHMTFIRSQKPSSWKPPANITQPSAIHTTYVYVYSAFLHSAEVGRYF